MSDSVTFSWEEPPVAQRHGDIVSYYLLVRDDDNRNLIAFEFEESVNSSKRSVLVTGLTPYYRYSYVLVTSNSAGQGPNVTGTFRSAETSTCLYVENVYMTLCCTGTIA